MVTHAADKMLRLKAFADDVVEDEQDVARVAMKDMVDDLEIIVVIHRRCNSSKTMSMTSME